MRKEKATGGKASSLWVDRWKRLKKTEVRISRCLDIVIFILIGALAPVIAPGRQKRSIYSKAYSRPVLIIYLERTIWDGMFYQE